MVFSITVGLCYEADNEQQAREKAEGAISLIPKDAEPYYAEVFYVDLISD
jgi:hypothetical protein